MVESVNAKQPNANASTTANKAASDTAGANQFQSLLNIDTGSGDDRIEIYGNQGHGGNANINTGSGDDAVIFGAPPVEAQSQQAGGQQSPDAQQQSADAQQSTGAQQPPIQSTLNIDTGSGDDTVEIYGNPGQGGTTTIITGSGDDAVILGAPPVEAQSQQAEGQQTADAQQQPADTQQQATDAQQQPVPTALNIDTGSGDDYVEINGAPPQNTNINTGSGDDTVILNMPQVEPEPEPEPEPVPEPEDPFGDGDGDGGDGDPLVLDMDRDGKVEATAGTGVDIDGDGKLDGAASGGDKMLAMTDLNGNGTIDGTEVFGNETINPFTGELLNAPNGFEALKMIAQSAEEHTGIDCMDDEGQVDVQKLKTALESVGVGLGLISDDNNTELESLGDVASIDTDYVEQEDSGRVQHRQLGNYTSTDGETHKADDIWFTS